MVYSNGVEIVRPFKRGQVGEDRVAVRIAGERRVVTLRHVSRETLNTPCTFPSGINLARADSRARRKARMRLRKRRGWR